MKTKYIYILTAVFILAFIFSASSKAVLSDSGKNNKDIIKFSHKLHAELEFDCSACHTNVVSSKSLNDRLLPEKDVCASCHDVEDDSQCQTCHYDEIYEPFIKSNPSLIYDHSFHSAQGLNCEDCHKGFADVDYSYEASQPHPPMNSCYSCHNDYSVASMACEACHISTADLIPQDHKVLSFFDNHKFHAQKEDAECAMCHENDFCESCHVSTNRLDASNSSRDFYTPYSPHRYTDNAKVQQLNRVHDLNYRFTHGVDAKGKNMECQTCHETSSFCAECHQGGGGDFALEGMVPLSHRQQDFIRFGVGSGGGSHAVLARRDIERCASCHDTYGADASCVLCHVDPDGIKGTNPKTHQSGYMKSVNGDWHSDKGSVCFDCHNDAGARAGIAGQGFCGYCHK